MQEDLNSTCICICGCIPVRTCTMPAQMQAQVLAQGNGDSNHICACTCGYACILHVLTCLALSLVIIKKNIMLASLVRTRLYFSSITEIKESLYMLSVICYYDIISDKDLSNILTLLFPFVQHYFVQTPCCSPVMFNTILQ